jgi:hypothetical protein
MRRGTHAPAVPRRVFISPTPPVHPPGVGRTTAKHVADDEDGPVVALLLAAAGAHACACEYDPNPVCAYGIPFSNKCFAKCNGFREDVISQGPCDPREDCGWCTKEDAPVCATGSSSNAYGTVGRKYEFGNMCEANCHGFKISEIAECACSKVNKKQGKCKYRVGRELL